MCDYLFDTSIGVLNSNKDIDSDIKNLIEILNKLLSKLSFFFIIAFSKPPIYM